MSHVRLKPEDRRQQLLESALVLLREDGYKHVTRIAVAAMTGTTEALTNRYFGSRDAMRAAVVEEAAKRDDRKALAQVVAAGYELTGLPEDVYRSIKKMATRIAVPA
jgi:AcrR family transcriptional regulator